MKLNKKIIGLILAAGESSRFGSPKQNVLYKNRTLLNYIKEQLNVDFVDKVYIVLGAYATEIISQCELQQSEYIIFNDWKQGMGSSLAYACKTILSVENFDALLVTLSDLPLVTSKDYLQMIYRFISNSDIVATKSKNYLGVPAIFGSYYFNEIIKLNGETGARQIIKNHIETVTFYDNIRAVADIDSLEDLNKVE